MKADLDKTTAITEAVSSPPEEKRHWSKIVRERPPWPEQIHGKLEKMSCNSVEREENYKEAARRS
jgi:hypothetical protein